MVYLGFLQCLKNVLHECGTSVSCSAISSISVMILNLRLTISEEWLYQNNFSLDAEKAELIFVSWKRRTNRILRLLQVNVNG